MKILGKILEGKIFRALVSLVFFVFVLRQIDFHLMVAAFQRINLFYFLISLVLTPFSILVRSFNWSLIVNRDEKRLSLKELNRLNLLALGANLFLPASAGELFKVYHASRLHGSKEELFSSVFLDKLTSLVAIFLIGSWFSYQEGNLFWSKLSFFFTLVSLTFLVLPRAFAPFFLKFFSPFEEKKFSLEKMFKFSVLPLDLIFRVLLVSLFGWLITYFQLFLFCQAFKAQVGFDYLLAISPFLTIARLFPFTLNGLGSSEAVLIYLFGQVGISSNVSLSISLTSQVANAFLPGFYGLCIYFQTIKNKNKEVQNAVF